MLDNPKIQTLVIQIIITTITIIIIIVADTNSNNKDIIRIIEINPLNNIDKDIILEAYILARPYQVNMEVLDPDLVVLIEKIIVVGINIILNNNR